MHGSRIQPARQARDRRGDAETGLASGSSLTRMTINLTARTTDALQHACRRSGQNKTDAINHAVQVLAVVYDLLERNDGRSLVVVQPDGQRERIYIL